MRIDLKRIAARIDRTLTDIFPPAPNGRIFTATGGAENDYGEKNGSGQGAIKVWVLIAKPKTTLDPRSAGGANEGLFEFTARGTTRSPVIGDVIEVDGARWRVTAINPDSPSGNYVDGFVELMA